MQKGLHRAHRAFDLMSVEQSALEPEVENSIDEMVNSTRPGKVRCLLLRNGVIILAQRLSMLTRDQEATTKDRRGQTSASSQKPSRTLSMFLAILSASGVEVLTSREIVLSLDSEMKSHRPIILAGLKLPLH